MLSKRNSRFASNHFVVLSWFAFLVCSSLPSSCQSLRNSNANPPIGVDTHSIRNSEARWGGNGWTRNEATQELEMAPASSSDNITTRAVTPLGRFHSTIWTTGGKRHKPTYVIDKQTKIIFINETNQSGYIVGRMNNENEFASLPNGSEAKLSSADCLSSKETVEPMVEGGGGGGGVGGGGGPDGGIGSGGATNFSVLLISQYKEHFAILIDIEEIDFENITNFCEYQELRFSVVGNIVAKSSAQSDRAAGQLERESDEEEAEEANENENENESNREAENAASYEPLPVSEAMTLLLNTPLNRTMLHELPEENHFKMIDTTIDALYAETCDQLTMLDPIGGRSTISERLNEDDFGRRLQILQQPSSQPKDQPARGLFSKIDKGQQPSRSSITSRLQQHKRLKSIRRSCNHDESRFKSLLSKKLNTFMEWDDFKIVCGRTNRLIIPMRSLKLSIFSDEFSPNSRFKLKYQFVSDPSVLPARDNGKYFCRNRNVIDLELKCNGYDDCGDGSDESIKSCGYPTGFGSSSLALSSTSNQLSRRQKSAQHKRNANRHRSLLTPKEQNKLTYFDGGVLHCCSPSDWQISTTTHNYPTNQALGLQSLIGDSMNLFTGPLFAPVAIKQKHSTNSQERRRVKRIVGGSEAHRGAWPGQVSLQYELHEPLCHFCAGTLIHPQYVLTAGHCITQEGLNRGIKVVLGAHDLRKLNESQVQVRYVDDAQIYPGVDLKHLSSEWENDMNNDLALLRLNTPVLITQQVAPACLPPFNTPLSVNTSCRSIGWGQTHGSGGSDLLKHLSLKVVDSSECSKQLLDADNNEYQDTETPPNKRKTTKTPSRRSPFSAVDFSNSNPIETYTNETMVCVNNDQGHGICQGDSGGPLYCDRVTPSGEVCTEIYGIASFIIHYATVGAMCAVENLPGIFGEVSSKTEWIASTIKMFEQSYKLKYS